jgi:hypothetical protein
VGAWVSIKSCAAVLALGGKKEADVGLVGYSNMDRWPAEMAKINVFMLTRALVER